MGLLVIFFSSSLFFFSPLLFSRGGLTDGRSKRRGRSPLAWRGLQPSTALLATGQSLCQVSTYRPTWIFSGLRRNDKPSLLFLRFSLTSSRRETPSSGYLHLSWSWSLPESSAPLAVLLWSRVRPVASVLSIRTLVGVGARSVSKRIGCATFFSHVIGLESKRLNLFEERLCLCFIMRLMNGWWLFERMIN